MAQALPILHTTLDRLARRFRFVTQPHEGGLTLEADELRLHIVEAAAVPPGGEGYTVVFEPPEAGAETISMNVPGTELEAVLRELLAG